MFVSNSTAAPLADAGPTWRERTRYAIWRNIAEWLPHSLVYACGARIGAHACCGTFKDQDPHQLLYFEAMRRWFRLNY
jgi:hypothetical protein